MDAERPHRTVSTTTTSSSSNSTELFICFTSRLSSSSSSMKISSKSILSPGRTDKPNPSLSASLSRRLKNNGSMKGGQSSPMFPTGAKKRGSGFENPEPSSPKVTCIGQVRVKTKKQTRKMRNMSARRSNGGDVSFRKAEQTQNGRWVHLPVTICEALRAFGSEFNCFLPCRSPCLSTEQKIKEEKKSSCGAVFARWLVALHEGEGKGREIELVVGEEEEEEVFERRRREKIELADVVERVEAENEEGRVSICIPPKNALLLMRCRSDPLRVSSLANRFWDSPGTKEEEEEEEDEDEVDEDENEQEKVRESDLKGESDKENRENGENEVLESAVIAVSTEEQSITEDEGEKDEEKDDIEPEYEVEDNNETNKVEQEADQSGNVEATMLICSRPDNETTLLQQEEDGEDKAGESAQDERAEEEALAKQEEKRLSDCSSVEIGHLSSTTVEDESVKEETSSEKPIEEKELENNLLVEEEGEEEEDEEGGGEVEVTYEEGTDPLSEERESEKVERESSPLPDCLLLMMCEPKLSMEVSKETWVCSTDFIRRMPKKQKAVNSTDGIDEVEKKRKSTGSRPTRRQQQPPRSSCSYPDPPPAAAAAASMAMMIEQKLVNAMAYEPFVLTRCKSEPMRSAAKMAVPESCFWKNRKLEPHRRSTVGVGAAGIGV